MDILNTIKLLNDDNIIHILDLLNSNSYNFKQLLCLCGIESKQLKIDLRLLETNNLIIKDKSFYYINKKICLDLADMLNKYTT